jgi:hypothetical protein
LRKKIRDLIVLKEVGETTLSLLREIRFHPKETVETYIFTDSIREHFETILDSIVSARGGGFWVQAEYGAGKTHFIATLSCLLMDTSETLWKLARDPEIRNYRFKVEKTRLFPVIINLKGEASIDKGKESLLEIIERHIEETLNEIGLKDKVSITTADEILDWYKKCSSELRDAVNSFIKQEREADPNRLPREQLAKFVGDYCERENIRLKISATTKDRIKHIYDQLVRNGYNGMLFVIDEFAALQMKHTEQSREYAAFEEVLETIAWVLPKDQRLNLYMVVASHLPAPTKLKEDRFKTVHLLADKAAKEYDIIVSQRVRELVEERKPEIEQYYQYYFKQFNFLKDVSREYFFSVFPFQPKCFEAIRNITKRELPTARSGINILRDILAEESVLERDVLVGVSDLLGGLHSHELETMVYRQSYRSYQAAIAGLEDLELDKEDALIAQRVLGGLFLWNLAYLETPKYLSVQELAEMTLIPSDIVKGEDLVESVLIKLRDLPQIEFLKEKGAIFRITGEITVRPSQIFNEIKKKLADQEFKVQDCWERSLTFSPEQTGGRSALFSEYSFDQRNKVVIEFQRVEYPGEVIVSRNWRPEYGDLLKEDVHFRVVILARNMEFDTNKLKDKRICACLPGSLNDSAKEAALNYLSITEMETTYASKTDPEAEETRQWIKNKKSEYVDALLSTQLALFKDGKLCTQQSLALDEKRVFATDSLERIVSSIVASLLSNAYQSPLFDSSMFKKGFSAGDAKKVFEGFLKKDVGPASVSACDNFAPGLELSKATSPRVFNPEGSRIFELFRKKLEESGGQVPIWKLHQEFGAPPYGLTKEILTLNLLCFVRHGDPNVEIRLKDNHRQPIRGAKITSFSVPEVDWRGKFEEDFDMLGRSTEVGWNDVLPFARIIAPEQELKTATKPEDIIEQERRLLLSLKTISDKIPNVITNLEALWSGFGQKFTKSECLDNIQKICKAQNYIEFKEGVTEAFGSNAATFKADVGIFRNLMKLSDQATVLLTLRSYLDDAVLPAGKAGLVKLKVSIQDQLDLESFVADLSKLDEIKKQFEEFKRQYGSLYQIHHREYYAKVKKAREQLDEVAGKVEAISRLNNLNMNLSSSKAAFSELLQKMTPCRTSDPVAVDAMSVCKDCRLTLIREPMVKEVSGLLEEADENVRLGMIRLQQMLTRPVLDLDREKRLIELMKAIKSDDVSLFVKALSDSTVEYLGKLMEKANIVTIQISISEFAQKYAFVEEDRIEEIVKAFREELLNKVEKAKKEKPGKKIRISLGE